MLIHQLYPYLKKAGDVAVEHYLHATYLEEHKEINVYLLREGSRKSDGDDLAMVNAARAAMGRKKYATIAEMREAVEGVIKDVGIGQAVTDLFDENVEITLAPIDQSGGTKKEGEE